MALEGLVRDLASARVGKGNGLAGTDPAKRTGFALYSVEVLMVPKKQGQLYFMDMEQDAIYRRTADGRIQLVVTDPRLIWPDTMAIGPDKYPYVTTSQHDRRAEFHHGEELRRKPYGIFKVFIDSRPLRAPLSQAPSSC